MRNCLNFAEASAPQAMTGTGSELTAAMVRLSDAIAVLDRLGASSVGLGLAAAHAETALHLVVAELRLAGPDPALQRVG